MENKKYIIFNIGVGDISSCYYTHRWMDDNYESHLFEPNIFFHHQLSVFLQQSPNVKNVSLHNVAIGNSNGKTKIYLYGNATYLDGVNSRFLQDKEVFPFDLNDDYADYIECKTIDKFDNGNINILDLQCEGSEWYCLKHLKSRPEIIMLELDSKNYINPYRTEIIKWCKAENYKIVKKIYNLTILANYNKSLIDNFKLDL